MVDLIKAGRQESRTLTPERVPAGMLHEPTHLRDLIDSLGDIVARFDPDGRFLYLNASGGAFAGRDAADFVGRTHAELGFSADECRGWRTVIGRVFACSGAEELEMPVDMGGSRRLYHWRLALEEGPAGAPRQVVAVGRDITESRHAEMRLAAYSTRMQEMARRLVQAQENERYSIAADLHDLLGQNLTAIGINLDIVRAELPDAPAKVLARLGRMKALVDETVESVRIALKDLRPHTLEEYGLAAALHSYANYFESDRNFTVVVSTRGPERRMEPAVELALYRIVQEAVANAARHSGAQSASVCLSNEPGLLRLVVEDGGRGFRTDVERRTRTRSLGLMLMQERADAAGAALLVDSAPGRGTRIVVEVSGKALEHGRGGAAGKLGGQLS